MFRLLLVLALVALPVGAHAQESRDASATRSTLGAVLSGGLGLVGGVLLGGAGDCYEVCEEMMAGAVLGEVVGVALGAHLFNGRKGKLWADLAVGAGVGGLGLFVASQAGSGEDGILVATAVAQITLVVLTEVGTSPTLAVAPRLDPGAGRVGVSLRLGF